MEWGTRPGGSVVVIAQGAAQGKQICALAWISGTGRQKETAIGSDRVVGAQGRNNAVTKLLTEAIKKENAGFPSVYYIHKKSAGS